MAGKNSQIQKKKNVKELNAYTESLETRLTCIEELLKSSGIDLKQLEKRVDEDSENRKKIDQLEKRINIIDKKVKHLGSSQPKKELSNGNSLLKCKHCENAFADGTKLKDHIRVSHGKLIKCRFCSETFDQTWKLETHICIHLEKKYKCEICDQKFHLKWRLIKHEERHKNVDSKFCHYFNNSKICPFQELGCMFRHESSPHCKYMSYCNKKRC